MNLRFLKTRAGLSRPYRSAVLGLALLLVLSSLLLRGAPANDKQLSIYSTAANYSVVLQDQSGQDYVGLLEVLDPLGKVSARQDGKRWKIRYNNVEGEFTPGKTRAKIQGKNVDLSGNFILENDHGLVPASSLTALMPRFLGGPVTFHESSRRLFVGSVGTHFIAQVKKTTPPSLVMDFTTPVNPQISTEPGKLRMTFQREPILAPGTPLLTFDSQIITSANYGEENGVAEIVISGTVPLFASFSNDGKTITVTAAPQNVASGGTGTQAGQGSTGTSAGGGPTSGAQKVFAVVDASHGGLERGAALTEQLAEKDVTALFAKRLRQELENRGISTFVLRDGDATLTVDQRATLTNQMHPAVYICVHASSQGIGVRLYTAALPVGGDSHGAFVDWNTAQSRVLLLSRSLEIGAATEFQKSQVPVRTLYAPLRPLNNLVVPALAVEVAPPPTGISDMTSVAYQGTVSYSIAAAVVAMRGTLEAP